MNNANVMERDMSDTAKRSPDLREAVAKLLNAGPRQFTPKQSRLVMDAVFGAVIELLGQTGVTKLITPIGVISLRERDGYIGKHPKTREEIPVPAKTVVEFRPSTALIRALAKRPDTKIPLASVYQKADSDDDIRDEEGE